MFLVIALAAGLLFGYGLALSGMLSPSKVVGFLDIAGNWDPSLAFVMGGAIIPMAIAWQVANRRATALLGSDLPQPPAPKLGRKLVIGSVMFGMGWGLAGLCPGPAVASLSFGGVSGLTFMAAMLAGMAIAPSVTQRLDRMVPAE